MMVATGPMELVVRPSEPLNNLNCNVESCMGSTRCHRRMHGCPQVPALFSWEVDPEIGYRV